MNAKELGNRPAMNAVDVLRDFIKQADVRNAPCHLGNPKIPALQALDRLARLVEADKRRAAAHSKMLANPGAPVAEFAANYEEAKASDTEQSEALSAVLGDGK